MKQTASVFAAWQQVSKDVFVKSGQIGLQPSCAAAVLTPLNNVFGSSLAICLLTILLN